MYTLYILQVWNIIFRNLTPEEGWHKLCSRHDGFPNFTKPCCSIVVSDQKQITTEFSSQMGSFQI